MSGRCDGWLSKIHPPKSLLKRSAVVKLKGPLSRSTPPRAMLMNKSRLKQYASDLTQNSPPPPQLMLATKQSTLGDYFGTKGDKFKPRIKEAPTAAKETTLSSIGCDIEESFQMTAEDEDHISDETSQCFLMRAENKHGINDETSQSYLTRAERKLQIKHETCQPVQITAKNKYQTDNETSLTHSLYQNHTSDLPLTRHTSSIFEDKQMNHSERDSLDYRQSLRAHKKLISSMPTCEKYLRNVDCNCNKENCLHGCERECLFCRGPNKEYMNRTDGEPGLGQGHVGQMLNDKNINTCETEAYITFSEGMKLLSQEHTVNNFSHSSSNSQNHIWSKEDECFHSQHTASSDSLKELSDSQSLHCVTEDTSSQCVEMSYPLSEVKVIQESFSDSHNISSLFTNGKQIRSPECVGEETNVAELEELGDSSELTLSHSSDNKLTCTRGLLQCGSLQDCETPDFVESLFTISTADTANETQSLCSQLSVLRGEQFKQRKAQYLSDLGTLALSENI